MHEVWMGKNERKFEWSTRDHSVVPEKKGREFRLRRRVKQSEWTSVALGNHKTASARKTKMGGLCLRKQLN